MIKLYRDVPHPDWYPMVWFWPFGVSIRVGRSILALGHYDERVFDDRDPS